MKQEVEYTIRPGQESLFPNHMDYCVGTGHMGLALQQEYLDQLELVQREIGFQYIRGHGLFCDDMAIYQETENADGSKTVSYNFTYLDRVMDSYRRLGLRPFLELGFMPDKMASGSQTVFYYKGNVTPPKDMRAWCGLVDATLRHLAERYGIEEVVQWPVEVWNEPNLDIFWENKDLEAYLKLFGATFRTVKAIDTRFRVGGPAVCDIECNTWISAFLRFCEKELIRPDFISRHHYTIEAPVYDAAYGYAKLHDTDWAPKDIHVSRELVDSFPEYRGMPMHLTEFNTAYIPRCPLHDTNQNAAYLAEMLSWLGEDCASYSYWTFGDVFEESGAPAAPFHGGFGLVANGCIPKPTFWTFAFYKKMQGNCVHREKDSLIVKTAQGTYRGIVWNYCTKQDAEERAIHFTLPAAEKEQWSIARQTVDEICCNPLKVWHDLGEPASLTEEQLHLLRQSAIPQISSEICTARDDTFTFAVQANPNAVVYFEAAPRVLSADHGYHYEKAAL